MLGLALTLPLENSSCLLSLKWHFLLNGKGWCVHDCGWNSRQRCQTNLVSLAKGALRLLLSLGTAVPVSDCRVGSPPNVHNCKKPTRLQSCCWHATDLSQSQLCAALCLHQLWALLLWDGHPQTAGMCSSRDCFVWAQCSWQLWTATSYLYSRLFVFFYTFIGMEMFVIDDAVKCFINGTMKLYNPLQLGGLPIVCLQEMLIANCRCDFWLSRILSIMCLHSHVSSFFSPLFSSVIIMDFFIRSHFVPRALKLNDIYAF